MKKKETYVYTACMKESYCCVNRKKRKLVLTSLWKGEENTCYRRAFLSNMNNIFFYLTCIDKRCANEKKKRKMLK